ncbi:glycosyltransferase involved in cell wall biosynthesis [Humitalea rosea]|uniref:Glycosyltransferase involved in cell wall biosynthesis n=1 Tax=Humitalea rosea TaxID=990373 RepID=A0A2W7INJ4_9PROT|nr:glycosyltransferase [Humitalea rosea]PZW49069.1 glycosyltransferase involved in cell wall biosynthesis [Humitalea rosea]
MSGSDAFDTPLGRADAARDRGEWSDAAAGYAEHLAAHPGDWRSLVQQGHALKEDGQFDSALAAYSAAEALAPDDADLQLQIGHLMKLQGRTEAAALRYAHAAVLDPANTEAALEAAASARLLPRGMPQPSRPGPSGADPKLVFDVTDMLDHFRVRRTPTGIQRVTLGILGPLLEGGLPPGAASGLPIAFAIFDPGVGLWRRVDRGSFAALAALSRTGATIDDPDWVAATKQMDLSRAKAGPMRFAPGAVLVNLGNAFGMPDYYRGLRWAIQTAGVRWLPFVHDCVPLEVPEHCLGDMVRDYARWFAGFGLHASGFLCNSENTRADVTRHLARLLPGHRLEGSVILLDADPRGAAPAAIALAEVQGLRPGEPFVLFCATIESRKDHHLVFSAWLTLLRKHGPARIPRLVCAGRQGWHAQAALDLLAQSPQLRRHVVLTGEISDDALAALYGACAFTVYNTHYEGWGLPVTESIAHGKVPVVPRHSSLIEAGGDWAAYFTPRSEPDLVAVLEPLMLDPAALEAATARLADAKMRSWSDLTLGVLEAVRALPELTLPQPKIEAGYRYPTVLSRSSRPELSLALADRLRDGNGWFPAENWGVWSRPGPAAVAVPLPAALLGAPLRLYLDIRPPPLALTLRITARAGNRGIGTEIPIHPGPDLTFAFELPELEDAEFLHLDLDTGPGIRLSDLGTDDIRSIGIGLRGVMLCRADDLLSRLAYVESLRTSTRMAEAQ